ncbi:MAG: sulfotransferase [Symploca sp. SIO2D2]|nr:sulfotransferase [Symploca sp. SIO2D2]
MINKYEVPSYQPIIIIGAGRSGTNMLRNTLTQLPGFGTWPCDEINYIWRHGNVTKPTDAFSPELATSEIKSFIREKFNQLALKNSLSYVVEKTCANSLRVGFVHQIFPNAKFIHIIRDGRDVVISAQKRWTAPLDLPYILKKAKFVPPTDIPYYSTRYLANRLHRLFSPEKRLASWGPRFEGMSEVLDQYSCPEVCAIQWQRCVEQADAELNKIQPKQVYRVRYEDYVINPMIELENMGKFLDIEIDQKLNQQVSQQISSSSIGSWKKELDNQIIKLIQPLIEKTLTRYNYNNSIV